MTPIEHQSFIKCRYKLHQRMKDARIVSLHTILYLLQNPPARADLPRYLIRALRSQEQICSTCHRLNLLVLHQAHHNICGFRCHCFLHALSNWAYRGTIGLVALQDKLFSSM